MRVGTSVLRGACPYLFYQTGGGVTTHKRQSLCPPAPRLHQAGFGQNRHVVIAALHQDIGLERGDERRSPAGEIRNRHRRGEARLEPAGKKHLPGMQSRRITVVELDNDRYAQVWINAESAEELGSLIALTEQLDVRATSAQRSAGNRWRGAGGAPRPRPQ